MNALLPLSPIDKQIIVFKDARNTFSINSLFINRDTLATYTIAGLAENIEIDLSTSYLVLVYDFQSNNWSI